VAVFAALSISGCGGSSSSGGSTGGGSSPAASGKKAPYTIVLANGFVGNEYKVEMENDFKAAVQMSPYKSIVKSSVYNAGDSVGTQTSQLQSIIASRPDAILLDSNSPTAENSVVQQACSEGIVVVTYDNEATAPCAAKISTSPAYFAKLNADYIVKELHGKGNVVMVTGVPGAPVDTIRNQVAEKIFAKYPGIHIIDKVVGQWDSATVERVLAPVIATYQNINAVWVSAGTDGAVTAFQQAGRKLPIIAGESENGFRVAIAKYAKDGFKGQSVDGSPVYLSVLALQYAIDVLEGKRKRGENIVFKPFVMTGANAKLGVNAFPNLPKGTFDDFQSPYVPMCPVGALKGTRCPGTLKVRIPPTS
jgi:ribose transport system substrate-binding protein